MKKSLLLILVLLSLTNYSFAEKRRALEMQLVNVEKTMSDNSIIDSTNISNALNSIGLNTTSYSDSLLEITWMYNLTHLDFTLKNIGQESYKILWDDMSYIDTENNGHRIFHKGVKMNDREKSQAPTVVMKRTNLEDVIIPSDYVSYNDYFNRWLFNFLHSSKLPVEGKEIKVLMPIDVKGKIIEYVFTFKLRDLKTKKKADMNGDGSWSYE